MANKTGKFKKDQPRDIVMPLRISVSELQEIDKWKKYLCGITKKKYSRIDAIMIAINWSGGEQLQIIEDTTEIKKSAAETKRDNIV